MSIEKHKAFFKSLDNEKMLPESFYRLLIPEIDRYQHGDEALSLSTNYWYPVDELWIGEHVLPKVVSRRAESRQIPVVMAGDVILGRRGFIGDEE